MCHLPRRLAERNIYLEILLYEVPAKKVKIPIRVFSVSL